MGELAAVSCSLFWALCSLAFAAAGKRVGAASVNFVRIQIAVVALTLLHRSIQGYWWPEGVSERQLTMLAVSGVIGLSIADLLLFHCMTVLGPRLGTLLMATAPAMALGIDVTVFGNAVNMSSVLGLVAVIGGLALVLFDRRGREAWGTPPTPRGVVIAVVFGLIAAVGQATGLILTDLGLTAAEGTDEQRLPPLSATWIRMVSAAIGMAVGAVVLGKVGVCLRACGNRAALRLTAIGAVFGPILGVWMLSEALNLTAPWVVATLSSLAPIFMIPVAWIGYGSKPTARGLIGTLLAVAGGVAIALRDEIASLDISWLG